MSPSSAWWKMEAAVTDSGKRMIGGLAAVFFLAALPPAAEAAHWWRNTSLEREQSRPGDFRPERRGPGYSMPGKGFHRGWEMQQRRLSPEERFQLRRDIRDAGRKIYPLRRHR
jgi:hypothetical protein